MEQIYTSHEIGDFMTKMILESYSNNIIIGKMCSIPLVKAQKCLLTRGYIQENGLSILMTAHIGQNPVVLKEVSYPNPYTGGFT